MNDVIRKALDWDVNDEDMAEAIYYDVESDPEGFIHKLLNGLLPMIDVGESPLTGKRYKGFSIDGAFEMKTEC